MDEEQRQTKHKYADGWEAASSQEVVMGQLARADLEATAGGQQWQVTRAGGR